VRLPREAAAHTDSDEIDSLIEDLLGLVGPLEKGLVYYDGPRSELDVCGSSHMAPLYAGRLGFSFLFLQASCNGDLGAGGVAAATAAHELVHSLGAVPLEGPPHGCQAAGVNGHACDDPADLMFPYSSGIPLPAARLDAGRDDYYGHPGRWWDVQDSAWLSRLPQRRLTVVVQAARGSGRVAGTPGAIDCGTSCEVVLDDGLSVRLEARPDPGSRLWSWAGACSGWKACAATMSADSRVVATFGPARYRVSVGYGGRGRVVSAPGGIVCGRTCGAWFAPRTSVRLRAEAAPGWRLARWSGACSGTRACVVRADRDRTATAFFVRR
jgi:hypothetical protein